MDANGGHLLALKVMRISRPKLAGQWQPFVAESTAFDAYNASSATSMQYLPADTSIIPSTVRDFSALSPNLSLPSSFGSISLGETFASCLCITNQTHYEIEGVQLRVEMQSASSKAVLLEMGGPDHKLAPSGTLEGVVQSDIKELGQHTLTCIVHYRCPPGVRPVASDDPSDPRAQLFRKHYRFPVSNPFSVKTKVHAPRSPTALMSRVEREKVFLEVHVQNLTQEPLWFERLDFKPVDGWTAVDGNKLDPSTSSSRSRGFYGPGSLVQPQDTFQYVYILSPAVIPSFPSKPAPGSVIPLGRLDMAWRSNFGEPGRLLTSMLSRKVPAAPPVQAPSALPPHLQRAMTQIPRSHSPTITHSSSASVSGSRPSSPVPYKSRQPNRPQTPVQALPPPAALPTDVEVDLVVDEILESDIRMEEPFSIRFTATAAAFVHQSRKRSLSLAIQHVVYSRPKSSTPGPVNTTAGRHVVGQLHAHSPTPSGASTPRVLSVDLHPSLVTSPNTHSARKRGSKSTNIILPSPYSEEPPAGTDYHPPIGTGRIEFLGNSLLKLPPFELTSNSEPANATTGSKSPDTLGKRIASQAFVLNFLPIKKGHANVGGIRVLLLTDEEVDETTSESATPTTGDDRTQVQIVEAPWRTNHDPRPAKVLHEWPVVAEVWVASG
ncbi:hypothetical protein M408DRAFT_20647 [Serendipita vermifera MAFF 305830]|uniref:DUF974-domain-containing protein n=1 Tax=Serendipita vermifera MAFF 305830 TaxID=933852 RepID=A0A0C2X254_SERVB|nr:hypothetical protein M408DRAFT_20647 [Serendipita vermifera MAFF 305830]